MQLQKDEQSFVEFRKKFDDEETGYSNIHGFKPQTLAYALQDSPVGFLSWILEKYWTWSDHGANIFETFNKNKILNTAMLYWLSGRVLSASRVYYETWHAPSPEMDTGPITVPIRLARFPKDPWGPPASLVDRNVYVNLKSAEMSKGGHFPAMEQPEIWAKDVGTFFSKL